MAQKEITVGKIKFVIPAWTLRQKLENKHLFLPFMTQAIVSGAAYREYDEETLMGIIIGSILEGIANVDIIPAIEKAFEGVGIIPEGKGGLQARTIEDLERIGVDIGEIAYVIYTVIEQNYGESIKKVMRDSPINQTSI